MVVAAGSVSISRCVCRCMFACPKGWDLKVKSQGTLGNCAPLLAIVKFYTVNLIHVSLSTFIQVPASVRDGTSAMWSTVIELYAVS